MAEVINLRLARKAKARAQAAQTASENRALHGQTRAAREKQTLDLARQDRAWAATRITRPAEDSN